MKNIKKFEQFVNNHYKKINEDDEYDDNDDDNDDAVWSRHHNMYIDIDDAEFDEKEQDWFLVSGDAESYVRDTKKQKKAWKSNDDIVFDYEDDDESTVWSEREKKYLHIDDSEFDEKEEDYVSTKPKQSNEPESENYDKKGRRYGPGNPHPTNHLIPDEEARRWGKSYNYWKSHSWAR